MEALVDAGLTKFIGVSNFQIPHMEEILMTARIKPVVNQIEYNRTSLRAFGGAEFYCFLQHTSSRRISLTISSSTMS